MIRHGLNPMLGVMYIIAQLVYIYKYVKCSDMRENRVIKLPIFRTMIHPVAQKDWKCCICRKNVTKGERYTHYVDRRAHEIIHYRFHDACFMMTEAYCAERGRTEFTPRYARQWFMNHHCKECGKGCDLAPCAKIMAWVKTKLKEI